MRSGTSTCIFVAGYIPLTANPASPFFLPSSGEGLFGFHDLVTVSLIVQVICGELAAHLAQSLEFS